MAHYYVKTQVSSIHNHSFEFEFSNYLHYLAFFRIINTLHSNEQSTLLKSMKKYPLQYFIIQSKSIPIIEYDDKDYKSKSSTNSNNNENYFNNIQTTDMRPIATVDRNLSFEFMKELMTELYQYALLRNRKFSLPPPCNYYYYYFI